MNITQREVSGPFTVYVWWTLCWWHDNIFVRGEEESVLDKDFVNKIQIQVLMTAVDERGTKGSALLEL